MTDTIPQHIETARAGTNPTLVCRVTSSWVVLSDMQVLSGYCILLADPPVASLNNLSREKRDEYLDDMATVGDALMDVTAAFRVNYAVAGNVDPYLHAHMVPRYRSEPEELHRAIENRF